jgi:inner membrane protein involved in colicin E2 resistance
MTKKAITYMTVQFSSCAFWLLLLSLSRFICTFAPPFFSSSSLSCALGNLYAGNS